MIEGNIDGVVDGALLGWAANPDTDVPVFLDLFLDDIYQGSVEASIYRVDPEDAGKGSGRLGFKFRIPALLSEGSHVYVVRIAGTGQELAGSPFTFWHEPSRTIASIEVDLKRVTHNNTVVYLQDLPFPNGKRRVINYVCVFGDIYTSLFLDVYILSQLARNNVPWVGSKADLLYAICTTRRDAESIIAHPNFRELERHCRPIFLFVEGENENRISLIEAADAFYALANEAATVLLENTFLVLAPDCLWADGAFRQAVRAVSPESGKRILLVPHFMRVRAERIRPLFSKEEAARQPIRLTPRTLVRMAREHRHAETRVYFKDDAAWGAVYQSHCLLDVGTEGVAARGSALHPLAIRLSGPIVTPPGTTVESVADSDKFTWDDIIVLTRRLLHVDCALPGAPRNAVARPFDFDDFGWYHAHGTMTKTRNIWKFPIELSEVPALLKTQSKWERAQDRILALVERGILYSRIELLDKTMMETLRRIQHHVDTTLTVVSSTKKKW